MMKKGLSMSVLSVMGLLVFLTLSGCESKDPSVLKIFVRSMNNELITGAQVIVIGDLSSNPPTNPYVDTVLTNESGFAAFNMDEYFKDAGEETVGFFNIIVKYDPKTVEGHVKCREHITAVETLYLPN
ncbi:MAG: hypothetical protein EP305_13095 [Bacteroidetes bacterium]|nr:MAG: hypothetical protein EP305_13095 [Bacteroidota bacterium]